MRAAHTAIERFQMFAFTAPATFAERTRGIVQRLKLRYGLNRHGNKRAPVDDLFYILLSRQTTECNFKAAYKNIRKRWPSWNSLVKARTSEIYQHVAVAGFGRQRAAEMKAIACRLSRDFGKVTLAPLSRLSTIDAEEYLTSLPGVGKKSARCVLMYAFNRQVFPVDVHCFRALNRLGLISCAGPVRNHEDEIQRMVPPDLRFTLHVTLVSLGRDVCHAGKPECYRCVLRDLCPCGATSSGSRHGKGAAQ